MNKAIKKFLKNLIEELMGEILGPFTFLVFILFVVYVFGHIWAFFDEHVIVYIV